MLYIIRYGEIGIKGKNRKYFEKALVRNIKEFCKPCTIERIRGRILVETEIPSFNRVFGIVNYSPAVIVEKDVSLIEKTCLSIVNNEKTFRISARRLSKNFPLTSHQLQAKVGAFIVQEKRLKVDLGNPELNIGVEILEDKAVVFSERIKGLGGLPVGTAGNVICRVSSKADELACLLAMKRGCLPNVEGTSKLLRKYLKREAKLKFKAEISGKTLSELPEKEETVFYPLINYSKQEIEQEYERFITN